MKISYKFLAECKKIGFLGFGISNRGVLEFLKDAQEGSLSKKQFTVRDRRRLNASDVPAGARIMCENDMLADINEELLFLSPTARREAPEIQAAVSRGIIITSDAEAFFDLVRGPVFGITGSDGKSTTCELSYRLLLSEYPRTHKSGNCGRSMLSVLTDKTLCDCHITELSSFMLEYMSPRLYRSVITNITENHLDLHGSYERYIRAKENILKNAEGSALWCDGAVCEAIAKRNRPNTLISLKHTAKELSSICDCSVTLEGGAIRLCGTPMLRVDTIKRSEPYNIKNFMSAIALCHGHFSNDALKELAHSFDGIEHRCKSLGVYGGIEYIDSSIDSSPERTRQTMLGLKKRVVLILGGRGKGLSYKPLCEPISRFCEAVVLCGENADAICEVLEADSRIKSSVPIYKTDTLKSATAIAAGAAKSSGTVLLSPASTSYNEFENFEERGKAFQKYIQK